MQKPGKQIQTALVATILLACSTASADLVTLKFDTSFGTAPATGLAPWIEAEFDDSVGDGSTVRLTVRALSTLGDADVMELYFNIAPGISLSSNNVAFAFNAGLSTGPIPDSISFDRDNAVGQNPNLRPGGDGFYNILLNLPNPAGSRFNQGEVLVFDIVRSDGELTAIDFFELGAPGPGNGNPGPFYGAAKLQETGTDGAGSDWVGVTNVLVVPLPAAGWLLISSLGLLGFIARRRSAAKA